MFPKDSDPYLFPELSLNPANTPSCSIIMGEDIKKYVAPIQILFNL